ncbi:unnamed protein product [Ectocarpus sp. 4 AP-2014]
MEKSIGLPREVLMRESTWSPESGSTSGPPSAAPGGRPGPRRPALTELVAPAAAEPPAGATGGTGRDRSTGEVGTCALGGGGASAGESSFSRWVRRRLGPLGWSSAPLAWSC